jgi:AcrR family transcriptional regulator
MADLETRRSRRQLQAQVAEFAHGRVPRALRRSQVLAVAAELFTERGFAASMDELARRVGVSKPVIYDLVGSKEALFGELVAQEAQELSRAVQSAVDAEPEPEKKLYAGALAFFRFAEQRRQAWDSLLTADATPVNAELAAARRFHATQVAAMLARGAADLGGSADLQLIDACAHAINGACEALAHWWKQHPELRAEALAAILTGLVRPGLTAFVEAAK